MKENCVKFGFLTVLLLAAVFLQSCSGGGGGGEGGSSRSADTGIRVLHAALDAAPVDIYVEGRGAAVGQRIKFGRSNFYSELTPGPQILKLTITQTPANVLAAFNLAVAAGQRRSILLYGGSGELPLQTQLIDDAPPQDLGGKTALRLAHGLIGAGSLKASLDGAALSSTVLYGSASAYELADSGLRTLVVKRAADNRTVASSLIALESDRAYTVLIGGDIDYFVVAPLFED